MQELIARGKVVNPWLGIIGTSVEELPAGKLGLPRVDGVLVVEVVPGGPAEKAGLRGSVREELARISKLKII
jgi:S1-C subfamily serine protease